MRWIECIQIRTEIMKIKFNWLPTTMAREYIGKSV